jgi:hypothetical protein
VTLARRAARADGGTLRKAALMGHTHFGVCLPSNAR